MKVIRIFFPAFLISCCFFIKLLPEDNSIPKYEEMGDGSIQAYFINLDKSTDRLAYITPKLEALGYPFTRIQAVYGKGLAEDYKASVTDTDKYRRLMHNNIGVGTIGCYLSHVKTWKEFLNSKHSYALIFEDDVDFDPAKLKSLIGLLLGQSAEWDFVNVDVNRHGFAKNEKQISRLFKLVKFRARVANASCYLINRKAAIEFVKRAFPISMPVDHMMMRPWELGIKIRGVTPQLVHQSFGDSEIGMQESKTSDVSLVHKITSLLYQITADVMTCINAYWNVKI